MWEKFERQTTVDNKAESIRHLLEMNISDRAVAAQTNVSHETIRKYRKALNINISLPPKITKEQEDIIADNIGKMSDAKVAKIAMVCIDAVTKRRKSLNIPTSGKIEREKLSHPGVYNDIKKGITDPEISKKYGISIGKITSYRKSLGILYKRGGRRKVTPEIMENIIDKRKSGMTLREITHDTGLSLGTIGIVCHKAGIKKWKFLTNEQKLEIYQLFVEGKQCSTIAKQLSVSTTTIRRYHKQWKENAGVMELGDMSVLKADGFGRAGSSPATGTKSNMENSNEDDQEVS